MTENCNWTKEVRPTPTTKAAAEELTAQCDTDRQQGINTKPEK